MHYVFKCMQAEMVQKPQTVTEAKKMQPIVLPSTALVWWLLKHTALSELTYWKIAEI